jgi:hypothetical protein
MVNIEEFIDLFLKESTKKLKKFEEYISTSDFQNKKISYDEWEELYLNWASKKDSVGEDIKEIPRILLHED